MLMHVAWKYCFYKIVCSVMQSDKHCQEHTKHKEKAFLCMPDILQSKLSSEQSTFIIGIQSRSCSYSSIYRYNDECMLSTWYDRPSSFFVLWLQIFIIVFQQRFFKCLLNYCGIKAL